MEDRKADKAERQLGQVRRRINTGSLVGKTGAAHLSSQRRLFGRFRIGAYQR